jgi:SAM-dependent methyltransferase
MTSPDRDAERAYLCVDDFLGEVAGTRALHSAFELGVIDLLLDRPACDAPAIAAKSRLDDRGLGLLLGLLEGSGAVERHDSRWMLSARFREALAYRDLMEAKLDFCALVAGDFSGLFTLLLTDPAAFFERSQLFRLFSYDRCFDATPGNLATTARWVRITTALTRYEAPACISRFDFARHARMLDVGGNSGEFALQACRANATLRATVRDLPLVCDLGEKHVRGAPEGTRVSFSRVEREGAPLPDGYDLVTFKSMLHDWPEDAMRQFLAQAYRSLEPGGRVLIYERRRFDPAGRKVPYAMLPLLLFFRSYREPGDYERALRAAGFREIRSESVELDMPFMVVSASR